MIQTILLLFLKLWWQQNLSLPKSLAQSCPPLPYRLSAPPAMIHHSMENIRKITQNYTLMMIMSRWQRSPSIVYWFALPWPAPVSAHWHWPGERHCVCFNPWSELNMETMRLFYICFLFRHDFFVLHKKKELPPEDRPTGQVFSFCSSELPP